MFVAGENKTNLYIRKLSFSGFSLEMYLRVNCLPSIYEFLGSISIIPLHSSPIIFSQMSGNTGKDASIINYEETATPSFFSSAGN
jgi:hypothetical protein